MKVIKLKYCSFLVAIFYCACKSEYKSSEITRFRKSLQPHLTEIVSKGIIGFDSSTAFIGHQATDNELENLSKSEHPVLRAVAIRAMLTRTSFNHFNVLMANLDDSAIVTIDNGEFGIGFITISDYLIERATWKDTVARNVTIDSIIMNHNYLQTAYNVLYHVPPQEKFYPKIKQMIARYKGFDYGSNKFGERNFYDLEHVLYALAKFKKKRRYFYH